MTPFQANLGYTPSFLPDLQGYFCSQSTAKLAITIKETQTQLVAHLQSSILDYNKHYNKKRIPTISPETFPHLQCLPLFSPPKIKKSLPSHQKKAPPPPLLLQGSKEYEVQEILSHCTLQSGTKYLIPWKGYELKDSTWEPEGNLDLCQQLLKAYQDLHTSS
ncbi:hypothetical protein DSO57_1002225 [Entomophthora muscae]|uniref:Uncharacterized protein n=1 Tax=Entomophthora muscae TaxID=34485 RepID=A0ACC2U7B1_9FUNG|nr:hypothetical protein DSO57_1002225 [Entomophthora muscae]